MESVEATIAAAIVGATMPAMLATFAAAAVLHAAPAAVSLEGYGGGGVTAEVIPTAVLLRGGVGLREKRFGADMFFETSVAHYGSPEEGCGELGAALGGCLYAPMLLGGQVSVIPLRWDHVEVAAVIASGWARRAVHLRPDERRDDWVVGGGLGVSLVWLPIVVRLQPRYLRYVTYAPRGFGNTNAFALTLDVGYRFDVW